MHFFFYILKSTFFRPFFLNKFNNFKSSAKIIFK